MGRHNINWPIPQAAIDANRLCRLSQNPDYDGCDAGVEKWETWEEAAAILLQVFAAPAFYPLGECPIFWAE